MQGYLGEIRMFSGNFEPLGWKFCNGQNLPIEDYKALYNIIGVTYGNDSATSFALPDFGGRAAMGVNKDNKALKLNTQGDSFGFETVELEPNQIPEHAHQMGGSVDINIAPLALMGTGTLTSPVDAYPAARPNTYGTAADTAMAEGRVDMTARCNVYAAGYGQPHENRQPFLCMNYIICVDGADPYAP